MSVRFTRIGNTIPDDRGSIPQRKLFELAKEAYPEYTVLWELDIPKIGLRFDIFILELGIAIEYDGEQHHRWNRFFHKDESSYIKSKKLDKIKTEFCEENGIKLVRFSGNIKTLDREGFLEIISKVPYPEEIFTLQALED